MGYKNVSNSTYRLSTLVGVAGLVFGLVAHWLHYNFQPFSIWGYELFAAPGMFTLSFFSEETPYKPIVILFLSGQFIGYFVLAFILLKVKQWLAK